MKRGPRSLHRGCSAASSRRASGLTRATMLDSWYSLTRIGVGFLVYPVSFRPRSQPAGHEMNLYGARSEKFLLVGLALSVAIVGVLTTLVIHQEHDPSTVADAPARTA